jgi:threonine aldolase
MQRTGTDDGADFRSDTLTRPTPAMREAMAAAVVGDDVFGEDPTVAELEREAAALLGHPAALFVPSGTMANQVAIHVHCRAGDELICDERSHVFQHEAGSAARLSGVQVRVLRTADGFPEPDAIAAAIRADDPHYPRSRLLVLENTHNMAGGRVCDPARFRRLVDAARGHRLAVHVDGARLCNAAVANGCAPAELAAPADSVSLCLSKGLGAPVGSVLAGSVEFVREARRARKAFGGGMRQAGILAAAGLLALRDGIRTLGRDHLLARRLAEALARAGGRIAPHEVQSNIVIVGLEPDDVPRFLAHLAAHGVRALPVGPGSVRFVVHRDVTEAGFARCLASVAAWGGAR